MRVIYLHTETESLLIKRFNSRESMAFAEVYDQLYNELYYFASHLYRKTEIVASDIIHDVFVTIWGNSTQEFEGIDNLKAYLFICIKNKFKNYIVHQKSVDKYSHVVRLEDENFISSVVESETFSIITQAINILPAECAKVFRMHLDGWQVKEIAEKLNKSESTIYAQKQEAISILKRKLSKHLHTILLPFI